MNGPSAAVMFSAPKRWGLAGFLRGRQYIAGSVRSRSAPYDCKTRLMKARIGRKVDFVRLLAREKRKEVAADTGEVATAAAVEDIPAEEAGPAPPLPAAAEETLDEVFEADPTPEPTEPPVSWRELLEDPQRWGPALQALYDRKAAQVAGLYSERRVTVRTRDLTIIALEGAAAGVLFAGSTAVAVVLFLRR